jgi:predicted dehydrogenase
VINHPYVDAVWICSPSQFHADQIKVGLGAAFLTFLFIYRQADRVVGLVCVVDSYPLSATTLTNSTQHTPYQACAAAGKHVFCEKPIATGLAETIEAINTCREANVKLMTALQVCVCAL